MGAPDRIFAKWTKRGNGSVSTPFVYGVVSDASAEYIRADIHTSELAAAVAATQAMTAENARLLARDAEARDFLQWAHNTLREINPSNYDHDDVCNLNDASVEVIIAIQAFLAAPTDEAAP